MTLKEEVQKLLEVEPRARERRNRARAVWKILQLKHNIVEIDKEKFLDLFTEIQSINRLILHIQQYEPDLRGEDYNDKTILEQEKKIELGYEPGYHQDVKKLSKIK